MPVVEEDSGEKLGRSMIDEVRVNQDNEIVM